MRTIQWLVFLGVTFCTESIRVPTDWNAKNPTHRFRISEPHQGTQQETGGLVENGLGKQFVEPTILHNPFQSNRAEIQFVQPKSKPTMILAQNGLYILPSTINTQTPHNQGYQDIKIPYQRNFKYEKPQKLLQNYNEPYDKYPTSPIDFLRIKPLASGELLYKPLKETSPNVLQEDNPTISSLPEPASKKPSTPSSLGFQVNQNVETIQFTTKKEPVFFVTEGYRNVLVQGPNKKKQYIQNESDRSDEGKRLAQKEESNTDEEKEDEDIPLKKRKWNEKKGFNTGGSSKNLVRPSVEKPQLYFENDDRRSRFNNKHLTKNYRDDRLHEPAEDFVSEREDDDKERISDDKEIEDDEEEEEQSEDTKPTEKFTDDKQSNLPETNEEDDEENTEDDTENERDVNKSVPYSEHADPKPIPTKPIYPGEGLWAKPGIMHRPHISPHRFLKPIEDEQKPDGHKVFDQLENFFENQKSKFDGSFGEKIHKEPTAKSTIKSPNAPNLEIVFDPFHESGINKYSANVPNLYTNYNNKPDINVIQQKQSEQKSNTDETPEEDEQDEDSGEEAEDFVPVRLYSQVRNSEDVSHEPRDPAEHGRLKELIRDTKVQTVYTEEGYEDSAYDHAGHEKKAEKDLGYTEFEREKQEPTKPQPQKQKDSDGGHTKNVAVSDKPLTDSIASETIYKSRPKLNPVENAGSSKNFMTTHELKTTQVKDKNNGDLQLEIQSEVKMVIQPNNSTEAHKYVKIYPKVLKEISSKPSKITENDLSTTESSTVLDNESATEKVKNYPKVIKEISSRPSKITENDFGTTESSLVLDIESATKNVKNYPKVLKEISSRPSKITENDLGTTESSFVLDIESATEKVKNYSKVLKEIASRPSKVIENDLSTTESSTNIESATKQSSEKPKVTVKVLDENGSLRKLNITRKKRAADESFEDVNIDNEFLGFIDKINHTFTHPKEGIDANKYPYYNRPELNLNSPLRYAENMQNIPIKREGELSFYKMADKLACPDIPQDINPLPEEAKTLKRRRRREIENNDDDEDEESEDEESEDEESVVDKKQPKGPRIQLGDKIDCLKVRYFGENPLDSPFFKEETVGPVLPIFKNLGRNSNLKESIKSLDSSLKSSELNENIIKINQDFNNDKFDSANRNKIDDNNKENDNLLLAESIRTSTRIQKPLSEKGIFGKTEPTPSPVVTLITTPKYTIQLTPKNIYDQIKLLDHLPKDDAEEEIEVTTKRIVTTTAKAKEEQKEIIVKVNKKNNQNDNIIETTQENNRSVPKIAENKGKPKEVIIEVNKKIYQSEKKMETTQENDTREPKMLLRKEGEIEEEKKDTNEVKNTISKPEALRRRIRPKRPMYQIFDVSKFLTTTPFPYISSAASTVLPKYKVLSEVFYKDEIKPNEQLNVFADVLNNIKNSSRVEVLPMQAASDFAEPSAVTVSSLDEPTMIPKIQYPTSVRVKKFQTDSSHEQNTFEEDEVTPHNEKIAESYNIQNHYQTNKSSTSKPDYFTNKISYKQYHNIRSKPTEISQATTSIPVTKQSNKKVAKRRRKPSTSTTTRSTTNIYLPNIHDIPSNHQPYVIDYIEDSEEVLGLVPPKNFQYRTITVDDTSDVPAEQIYEYSTLRADIPTESIIKKHPAPVTELNDEAPAKRPMNKYYFVGLKPPVQQRVRPYSEFNNNHIQINNNLLHRRVAHLGLTRVRRSAARPSYADVTRNRGHQSEGLSGTSAPVDDTDDYVPHRPKNYHYDEKTGKIIYHNKPTEEKVEEEDEVEYEEIPDTPGIYLERAEDATHPTPEKVTTKELLATASPPPEGKGLLDFVVKLKNNPSYKYIPDPTTPKPGSVTSTTEAFATVDPKSTNPPEFLNILSKVKNDKTYKYIEDPKESQSKTKATITTPKVEIEEEYEDEEEDDESVSEHIQNSPGGQNQNLGSFQIFDIGDYLPKIKTFTPRTTIDYSKYKTIERPHTRHNISSKYNSEEETESVVKEDVVSRPPPKKELVREEHIVIGDVESVVSNKGTDAVSTTTQRIVQLRRGTRPTTQKTTAETTEPTESTRRSVSRRRPLPSGFKTNRRTTATSEVTEATEQVEKIYPENYSTERAYSDTHDKAKRVYRRRPVRIRHTTERHEEDDETIDRIVRRSLDPEPGDIEIDLDRKQIENTYQEIKDEIINDSTDRVKFSESRKTEIVEKIPKDAEVINKAYDKTRKHGGNYRRENEQQELEKQKLLEDETSENRSLKYDNKTKATVIQNKKDNVETTNKDYDIKKKHGGNYRKEFEDEDSTVEDDDSEKVQSDETLEKRSLEDDNDREATINQNKNDNVEITNKDYDKKKKHGGDYRKEFEDIEDDSEKVATVVQIKNNSKLAKLVDINIDTNSKQNEYANNGQDESEIVAAVVELENNKKLEKLVAVDQNQKDNWEITNKDYDKKNKHGKNYGREFEGSVKTVKHESSHNKKDNVEVTNKDYDKKKKHGGNYRREFENEDTEIDLEDSEKIATALKDENKKGLEKSINGIKKEDVDIINKHYDIIKKHGGNYKSEEDAILDELLANSEKLEESQGNLKIAASKSGKSAEAEVKTRTSTEQPKRLSDVVPKPDHFYSDPQLPKQINKLESERPPVNVASEEIDQIAMEGDLNVEIEKPQRPIPNLRRRMFDDDFKKDENEKISSTKKPLFIKDPSQRLYFYATV